MAVVTFLKASNGLVKFIGMAPEESSNAIEFIQEVKDRVNVSLAHTNADYETAATAFAAGPIMRFICTTQCLNLRTGSRA